MRTKNRALKTSSPARGVLLLGAGFSMGNVTSDKNFWSGFVRNLSGKKGQVVVISINHSTLPEEHRENVHVYNVRPFFDFSRNGNGNGIGIGSHNPYLYTPDGLHKHVEMFLTQLKLIPLLRRLIRTHNVKTIHLLDSFGWTNRLFKILFPGIRLGLTLITFNRWGRRESLYSFYQKLALRKLDYVVVTSPASRKKVVQQGIRNDGVSSINWGIESNSNGNGHRVTARLSKGRVRHCLWTGFIQQIDRESFQFTRRIARRLSEINPEIKFTFAFKPECLPSDIAEIPEAEIKVISTGPNEFTRLLKQSDLLISPILNYRSVCAPPLSWIESLAQGIPIVSTPAPGVAEILIANQAGLVGRTADELAVKIAGLLEDPKHYRTLSANAKKLAQREYSLDNIVNQYLQLWEDGNGLPG
ncbi:MAG: glycosyltransferase [candidate division Zixibacteria bacterium]|nr:glycosyltransferase [candidate division Zixibacteria bacterium]